MKKVVNSIENNSPNISDKSNNRTIMESNRSEKHIYNNMSGGSSSRPSSNESLKFIYGNAISLSNSNQSKSSELSKQSKNSKLSSKSKNSGSSSNSNRQTSQESVKISNHIKLQKKSKQKKDQSQNKLPYHLEYSEQQTIPNLNKKKSKSDQDSDIPDPDPNSNMVYLNIYDLDSLSKVVNTVAKTIGTGAFHAGVEVYGSEYSFGYITDGETGVTKTIARSHPYHVYRETIPMGRTPLTKEEVNLLVEVMKLQWIGDTYDLLSRNCLNYADYFCNLLDVGGVPEWVMSLQKKITWVKSNINVAATKLKALNKAAGIPNFLKFIQKKYKEDSDEYHGCKVIVKS